MKVAAPWRLKGEGYIFLYNFPKEFVEHECFLPDELEHRFQGGMGAMMLVDYHESPVGPYQELLLIPGAFAVGKLKRQSITKIYVSTQESIENGKRNWAIPKELAEFTSTKNGREERITVRKGKRIILDISLERGFLPFPVLTSLLPFPLLQFGPRGTYLTCFQGHGVGKRARIVDLSAGIGLFPDVSRFRPLTGIKINNFSIIFPEAEIKK
jgi:hypothetical protein